MSGGGRCVRCRSGSGRRSASTTLEDWSVEQVAEAMGIAVGTVKATLAQGRATLRRSLGDVDEEAR
ncbi:MAG: sigma factor-like helix-turn-helix DNA-binding protein [Ilumatobacteraceae bacterium]